MIGAIRQLKRNRAFFDAGQLTDEGRKYLKSLGVDPDSVTPHFLKEFDSALAQATPEQAARVADAKTLPEPVPLSRGDVLRDPATQALESAAERGALGENAQRVATGFREAQQEALGANVTAMQGQIGAGRQAGEGIAQAQQRLFEEASTLKTAIRNAYDSAKDKKASVLTEGVDSLLGLLRGRLQGFNPRTAPKATGLIKDLQKFSGAENVKAVSVKTLENWRQQVAALARSNDSVERAAATELKRSFDDFFESYLDEALVRGDSEAIEAFKKARGLRTEYAKKFEADRIVKDIVADEGGELILTPTEALNKLFTAGKLTGKQGSVKALKKIRMVLGRSSDDWKAIKEEAFLRLFVSQEKGSVRNGALERVFSGDKFATSLEASLRESPELMELLFTSRELEMLNQFKRVALSATNRVPGAVNFSGTATVEKILGQMGFVGQQVRGLIQGFIERGQETLVRQSLSGALQVAPIGPGSGVVSPLVSGEVAEGSKE